MVAIGRFFASSKMCGACGWIHELNLSMREWDCLNPACGVHHDRDLNAARNIDREGKRLFDVRVAAGDAETQNACGDLVSPIVRIGTGR
ncbi:transposase [Oscillochloris sp. ZM17-4]|nr:transposase [Oscillochloris sp. ZM17-4]